MKTTLTILILSSTLLINTGCVSSIPSFTDSKSAQNSESNATEEASYIEKKLSRIFNKIDEIIDGKIERQNVENDVKEREFDLKTDKYIEEKINKI